MTRLMTVRAWQHTTQVAGISPVWVVYPDMSDRGSVIPGRSWGGRRRLATRPYALHTIGYALGERMTEGAVGRRAGIASVRTRARRGAPSVPAATVPNARDGGPTATQRSPN